MSNAAMTAPPSACGRCGHVHLQRYRNGRPEATACLAALPKKEWVRTPTGGLRVGCLCPAYVPREVPA